MKEDSLKSYYEGATVTVGGTIVMMKGRVLDTPLARNWWRNKLIAVTGLSESGIRKMPGRKRKSDRNEEE